MDGCRRSLHQSKKMRFTVSLFTLAILGSFLISQQVSAAVPGAPENSGGLGHAATSLCAELVIPNNYPCTEHQVVTLDGFILGIQNLPAPQNKTAPSTRGRPVILQHGLTAGGDNFVDNGPQQSLAFVLADAGFDVWITNSRAIQWSHGHQTLVPSESAYWDWTYDELASYDLLAITQFVSSQRGGMQVGYIGHSLGTTIIFAGLTGGRFRSQILAHLNAVVLLAPIALSYDMTAPLLVASVLQYSTLAEHMQPPAEYSTYEETQVACGIPVVNPALCYAGLEGTVGTNSYIDPNRLAFYIQYFPQPTSTTNYNHLGQGYVRKNFAFYDNSTLQNQVTPIYDLTTFPACLPTQYWVGGMDQVADPTNVAQILAQLPSTNREVNTLSKYGHVDFILGTNGYIDLYPRIITYLNNHIAQIHCT